MEDAVKKFREWERESARGYAGFAHNVSFKGIEYLIDKKHLEEAYEIGAKPASFSIFPWGTND